ncbi:putative ribosomal protein S11, DNA-directed RNA polymerase, RBP11-like dimerization domain protein, partial [Tanacetum coccineum]
MAKAIPKKGSRGRIGSRKSTRKIPKGVIHIQASFNNTIVTVTDVRGRVVSWSSAGTCGFRGTRRGTPFAAQTAAANAIRAVVDQCMLFAEVWKCVESAAASKRLFYGRLILSPLMKGQADTMGMALQELCLEKSKEHASICVRGPGYVTAQDIILPPYVEIVDNTQHIATLTEPIELVIGLQIEKNRGYLIKAPNTFQDGSYPIDPVFMPVRNANHSIHSYEN